MRVGCLAGCVDVLDTKVLRDAHGCQFVIKLVSHLNWTQIEDLLPAGSHVFLADSSPSRNPTEPCIVDYTEPCYAERSHTVLVVGGETEGLSRSARQLYTSGRWNTRRVHIPMSLGVDSLNSAVSASIILYEIYRQMTMTSVTHNTQQS